MSRAAKSSYIKRTDVPGAGSEPWCGTSGGYTNHKCRCDGCRAEWAADVARMKAARVARLAALPPEMHGKYTTYGNYSCRCSACRAAYTAYARSVRG